MFSSANQQPFNQSYSTERALSLTLSEHKDVLYSSVDPKNIAANLESEFSKKKLAFNDIHINLLLSRVIARGRYNLYYKAFHICFELMQLLQKLKEPQNSFRYIKTYFYYLQYAHSSGAVSLEVFLGMLASFKANIKKSRDSVKTLKSPFSYQEMKAFCDQFLNEKRTCCFFANKKTYANRQIHQNNVNYFTAYTMFNKVKEKFDITLVLPSSKLARKMRYFKEVFFDLKKITNFLHETTLEPFREDYIKIRDHSQFLSLYARFYYNQDLTYELYVQEANKLAAQFNAAHPLAQKMKDFCVSLERPAAKAQFYVIQTKYIKDSNDNQARGMSFHQPSLKLKRKESFKKSSFEIVLGNISEDVEPADAETRASSSPSISLSPEGSPMASSPITNFRAFTASTPDELIQLTEYHSPKR